MEQYEKLFSSEPDYLDDETWFKVSAMLKHITSGSKRPQNIITFREMELVGDSYKSTGRTIRWFDDGDEIIRIDKNTKFDGEGERDEECPMVYKIGHVWFSFRGSRLSLNFQAGPLFGRGRSYDYTIDHDGNVKLFNEHTSWIS